MGYDVHITRKNDWSESEGPVISEAEWREAIAADPELSLDENTRVEMADSEFIFAAWKGREAAMGHYAGEITAKNADQSLLRKMVQIAKRLNAKVQGDDGEVYGEDGLPEDDGAAGGAAKGGGLLARLRGWLGK
jgi:hypothetical protein